MVTDGERNASSLIEAARAVFAVQPEVRLDYIEMMDWATLLPVDVAEKGTLFAVAAWVGATRLIDNTILS
jgi:pantoate--beta-alanine ligase